jgi:hypothetical protein
MSVSSWRRRSRSRSRESRMDEDRDMARSGPPRNDGPAGMRRWGPGPASPQASRHDPRGGSHGYDSQPFNPSDPQTRSRQSSNGSQHHRPNDQERYSERFESRPMPPDPPSSRDQRDRDDRDEPRNEMSFPSSATASTLPKTDTAPTSLRHQYELSDAASQFAARTSMPEPGPAQAGYSTVPIDPTVAQPPLSPPQNLPLGKRHPSRPNLQYRTCSRIPRHLLQPHRTLPSLLPQARHRLDTEKTKTRIWLHLDLCHHTYRLPSNNGGTRIRTRTRGLEDRREAIWN